jgi:alpha-L-arabinofuranosidase
MGNGFKPDGKPITGNDPNDANTPVTVAFEKEWVEHLVGKFGKAENGGIPYYLLDNETGLWQSTHRDVFPVGVKMDDLFQRELNAAKMIKSIDPSAQVCGPESWNWPEYFNSGYDEQWAGDHNYKKPYPDQAAHGGMAFIPWLLQQFAKVQQEGGHRLLDVLTVHYYPQENGVSSDNTDPATILMRNKSTRVLWDPNYKDESWINDKIDLIPRLKDWVKTYYPGTKIGITEYSWGAENNINGAIAQADVLGIFGREGLDLAARWTCPRTNSLTFNAIRMYRNYDGKDGAFGDVSLNCETPNPDICSAFASEDSKTKQLKIMVINKQPSTDQNTAINLTGYNAKSVAAAYQLTSTNRIEKLGDVSVKDGSISLLMPAQSIRLVILNPADK